MAADERTAHRIDFEKSVGVLLAFLSNRMTSTGSASYRKLFGLGILDCRLLIMLAAETDIAPARISEVTGVDTGAISRALRGLEQRGLVTGRADRRHPSYRHWSLTPEGVTLYDRVAPIVDQREAILLESFSGAEREQLIAMLQAMLSRVERLRDLTETAQADDD